MADDQNPDSPTKFTEIGKQIAAGMDAIGFIEKLAKSLTDGSVDAARKVRSYGIRALALVVSAVVGALFDLIGQLDPAFGALAATVVGNMFEVPVDSNAFTNMKESGGRKQIAIAVGASLLSAFKGDQATAGAGELEPSTTAAEAYLGVMSNLAIEGWVFEVIGALVPDLELEKIGELKDAMARVLGLGRLSRTALSPFVRTLIAQPAQWALNKQYRPKMLSVSEALHAWRRGEVDTETLGEIAARDGFGDDALEALKNAAWSPLSAADARLLVDAGVWSQPVALDELRVSEGTDERVQLAWQLEDLKLQRKFELEMVTAAANAYAEHKIDADTFRSLLNANTISARDLGRLDELASQRRKVNQLHLSRADIEFSVENGVLNVTDYHDWLEARGYATNDALTLELNMQVRLKKLEDARTARAAAAATRAATRAARDQASAARRAAIAAEHVHWSGTLSQAERLVVRGVLPATLYRATLIDHGIADVDADALVTVALQDRDARTALLAKRAAAAGVNKPKALPIATLVHAILLGARSLDELAPAMLAAGFTAGDAQLEVDVVTQELAHRAAAAAAKAARAPAGSARALTLAQLERAVLNGAASLDQYRAATIAAGYDATASALLVADLQARIDIRKFADARRQLAEERLAASHLSLATEEQAVIKGLKTLQDFQAYLGAHGFDASDQALLVSLLELKLPAA